MEIQVIKTKNSHIWRQEDGIIVHEFQPHSEETLETAKENCEAIVNCAAGSKALILSDPSHIASITKEARAYYSSSEIAKRNFKAVGCISTTRTGTVIANFFIVFSKTSFPFRMFQSKEDAIAWLKTVP